MFDDSWSKRLLCVVFLSCCTEGVFSQTPLPQTPIGDTDVSVKTPVRPNVLFILLDELGVDMVDAYGESPSAPTTPVIQSIADQGLLFRNAWATPGCSPTRALVLTGRYGFRTGIGRAIAYGNSDVELSVDEHTIADSLRAINYRTAVVGKWHLGSAAISGPTHALQLGFQHHFGAIENFPNQDGEGAYYDWEKVSDGSISQCFTYATTQEVDDAVDLIEGWGDKPWFLWLAFNSAHAPYHKPPSKLHTYQLPANVQNNIPIHARAMAEAADTEIGRMLDSMAPEVLARTYVIICGDNGTPAECVLPPFVSAHGKATLYEGGVNVPLIMSGPGIVAGQECDALVSLVDLFATIAELTGCSATAAIDSMSLVPYLGSPGLPSIRPWVYSEAFGPNGLLPSYADDRRAVRDERYKLIVWMQGQPQPVKQEFYDLWASPWERTPIPLDHLTPQQQEVYDGFITIMGNLKPWY